VVRHVPSRAPSTPAEVLPRHDGTTRLKLRLDSTQGATRVASSTRQCLPLAITYLGYYNSCGLWSWCVTNSSAIPMPGPLVPQCSGGAICWACLGVSGSFPHRQVVRFKFARVLRSRTRLGPHLHRLNLPNPTAVFHGPTTLKFTDMLRINGNQNWYRLPQVGYFAIDIRSVGGCIHSLFDIRYGRFTLLRGPKFLKYISSNASVFAPPNLRRSHHDRVT